MSYHESPPPGRTDVTQLSGQAGLLCWTGQEFTVWPSQDQYDGADLPMRRGLRFSGAQSILVKKV